MSGGRSDQNTADRALRDLTDRVRALEATPTFFLDVTGEFIFMEETLPAVAPSTEVQVAFSEVAAAGNKTAAAGHIASPFANQFYSWDSGVSADLVNVLTPGSYIAGLQCRFGVGPDFPASDFSGYVRKTGSGGGQYATQQPLILQQQSFKAGFNFSPSIPFDNAGIDYTKPFVFTPVEIGGGISFGIAIGHDHPVALDCIASLIVVKASND